MSQRISLEVATLMGSISLIAMGMMWHFMEKAQAATRELADETRATNRVLLKRLIQLSVQTPSDNAATVAPQSPDWNPIKAHLVMGEKDGPPAEGWVV